MLQIIGFILFFFFIILIIGLTILSKVVRAIFRTGQRATGTHDRSSYSYNNENKTKSDEGRTRTSTSGQTKRKKVFDNSEGEYIDFEEIKE